MKPIWWGLQAYEKIQSLQLGKVPQLMGHQDIELWGLEFEPTITLGLRARAENDLKTSADFKFKIIKTDRGGRATLHSPGQLVIFPMLDLKVYRLTIPEFVELLFRSTVDFLARYQIKSYCKTTDPGVYTERGKIAFCGLKVDSGVVRHGLSINIDNDLKLFDSLVPCGNPGLPLDRLIDYKDKSDSQLVSLEHAFTEWSECFQTQWKALGFS